MTAPISAPGIDRGTPACVPPTPTIAKPSAISEPCWWVLDIVMTSARRCSPPRVEARQGTPIGRQVASLTGGGDSSVGHPCQRSCHQPRTSRATRPDPVRSSPMQPGVMALSYLPPNLHLNRRPAPGRRCLVHRQQHQPARSYCLSAHAAARGACTLSTRPRSTSPPIPFAPRLANGEKPRGTFAR